MEEQQAWRLGQISEHYESRGRGPGTISTGRHDHGGTSYGVYQLSSSSGTLDEYLDQSAYGKQFKGLNRKSEAFDAKWRELAAQDSNFALDQQNFIRKELFEPQVEKLKARGMDLSDRGPAVQEALWSTSVQLRNLTPGIFANGLEEKFGPHYKLADLSDRDIVGAVQDYKISHNEHLFKHSKDLLPSLRSRAEHEKEDLLGLADGKFAGYAKESSPNRHDRGSTAHVGSILKYGDHSAAVSDLQHKLAQLGYTDSKGHSLLVDERYGPSTENAVMAFQREHDLLSDGRVGNKTMTALDHELEILKAKNSQAKPLLDDPSHPDHKLFCQAREHVYMLDARFNRKPDQHSDNLAGAISVGAKKAGMAGIDALTLSDDHDKVVVFDQHDSLLRRFAAVDIVPAMNETMTQSTQRMAAVNATLEQKAQEYQSTVVAPSLQSAVAAPSGRAM